MNRWFLFATRGVVAALLLASQGVGSIDPTNAIAAEGFDAALLEAPRGKDLEFYLQRRDAIRKERRRFAAKAASREEYEATEKKIEAALDAINVEILTLSGRIISGTFEELAACCVALSANGLVEELQTLVREEEKRKSSDARRLVLVESALIDATIVDATRKNDAAELRRLIDRLVDRAVETPTALNVDRVERAARALRERDPEMAKLIDEKRLKKFLGSGNEALRSYAVSTGASERYANLVGNELRFEGVSTDGTEIDWDSYRGKVVLVDFWATWCGPCRAELPNVKAMYEKYRDCGFEVVGYSCDSDVAELDRFVRAQRLPWKNVSHKLSTDSTKPFVDLLRYYAINGIPKLILVDREGRVIDCDAKGTRLQTLLRGLFPNVR